MAFNKGSGTLSDPYRASNIFKDKGGSYYSFTAAIDDLKEVVDGLQAEVDEIDVDTIVTTNTAQTITGAKTFSQTVSADISGNAATATKLATARTIRTNLASTSAASFDGTANVTPGVTGILPITNGGTGTSTGDIPGNAATATKLATARTIRTNLASTSTASFDGSANITPGVTGTLPISNGGTGLTSSPSMLTNLASTSAANVLQSSPRPGVTGTLPISNGGTGATTVSGALSNLGLDSLSDDYIVVSGSRGTLKGYETVATSSSSSLTINSSSADTTVWTTSGSYTLSFTAAGSSYCGVKVIACKASAATTLTVSGATWANNDDAPDWGSSGALLVLVAHFIAGSVILNVFHNSEA